MRRVLQAEATHADTLATSLTMSDGRNMRAHQQAAGARKGGTHRTKA